MAHLISCASGNFTDASSWALVNPTSLLDSEAGSTASTTSQALSSSFTPGAITIDGVAVKFAAVQNLASGTVTITLRNVTGGVNVKSVTIQKLVSGGDFNNLVSNLGWYFFKFDAPVTLLAATAYAIGFQTSSAGLATLYRDGTANNWSRLLRTTTNQAPANPDILFVMGEHISAGVGNDITITMNNTTSTSFGVVSGTVPSLSVNKRGTLQYDSAAATNYYLRVRGFTAVYPGAIFTIGTTGTPIPSNSTAVFEFNPTTNVDSGLQIFPEATFTSVGATKTNIISQLTVSLAVTNTNVTVANTTDWLSNDVVVITPTERVSTQAERRTILSVTNATDFVLTAGVGFAHSGNVPAGSQGRVGNLTRNVKIRGLTTALQGYILAQTTSTVNIQNTEISLLGSNTVNRRGIDVTTTTGSFTIQNSSLYDFSVTGASGIVIAGGTVNNINISNNVSHNINTTHINLSAATSGAAITINGNLVVTNVASNNSNINLADIGGTITNNIVSGNIGGSGSGIALAEANATIGTFSGNIVSNNANIGISITGTNISGTALNNQSFRNAFGLNVLGSELIIDGLTAFGNSTTNIEVSGTSGKICIVNSTIHGGNAFTCPIGLRHTSSIVGELLIDSTTFGVPNTHATGDITIPTTRTFTQTILNNVRLASTNQVVTQANMTASSFIGSSRHNQIVGSHRTYKRAGNITIDTVIADVNPSQRLTPTILTEKLESGFVQIPINSGTSMTVSVKVRQSVIGDGTAYNGSFARLILKKNDAAGILADTVIATATVAANGAWETISGSTPVVTDDAALTFYVDCNGTTGWVNLDTWSAA